MGHLCFADQGPPSVHASHRTWLGENYTSGEKHEVRVMAILRIGSRQYHPARTGAAMATVAAAFVAAVGAAALSPSSNVATAAAATQVYRIPATGSITVTSNGNGHGHGLSQYGAQGFTKAVPHATAVDILRFYYPGTTETHISPRTTIRVVLSTAGGDTCVRAIPGMSLLIPGQRTMALSLTGGVKRFRLAPYGSGLMLQKNLSTTCGGTWQTVRTGLPAQADFHGINHYVVSYRPDATYTAYRGTIGALRQGSGERTINRVGIDSYTEGVVPREMPASWNPAAIHAQAIAARTYADFERLHSTSQPWDICDTSACQVYGGMTHYSVYGQVLWTEDPKAILYYSGDVLTYAGSLAFTQYSASNGGWSVYGGVPYMIARQDPYDTRALGDPYVGWVQKVPVTALAQYYRLRSVSEIAVTRRDGHGAWGGRILNATVYGRTSSNQPAKIATTGFALQAAMHLLQDWFTISS
jgi:SpoIID/LytB domain protein